MQEIGEGLGISLEKKNTNLGFLRCPFLLFGNFWKESAIISLKDFICVWRYIEGIYT